MRGCYVSALPAFSDSTNHMTLGEINQGRELTDPGLRESLKRNVVVGDVSRFRGRARCGRSLHRRLFSSTPTNKLHVCLVNLERVSWFPFAVSPFFYTQTAFDIDRPALR